MIISDFQTIEPKLNILQITKHIFIPISEVDLTSIRAQGADGQNVNKASTAIHLRFNIAQSSLSEVYKTRLLYAKDYRIYSEGVIVIKAQRYRSQEQNKADALQRLVRLIRELTVVRKKRKKQNPLKPR